MKFYITSPDCRWIFCSLLVRGLSSSDRIITADLKHQELALRTLARTLRF